ncbi:hypothetical protein BG842_18425 [Haladaptatus sp. W1]|nr:hypothetical protein BG842_18425 [Haladaptatus sp. W1]
MSSTTNPEWVGIPPNVFVMNDREAVFGAGRDYIGSGLNTSGLAGPSAWMTAIHPFRATRLSEWSTGLKSPGTEKIIVVMAVLPGTTGVVWRRLQLQAPDWEHRDEHHHREDLYPILRDRAYEYATVETEDGTATAIWRPDQS